MFSRLPDVAPAALVELTIDGEALEARGGDTVAAALFLSGRLSLRDTIVRGAPRGPFCMMGVCYDCLVTIDGHPNQQACMTCVRPAMRVERQNGPRTFDAK